MSPSTKNRSKIAEPSPELRAVDFSAPISPNIQLVDTVARGHALEIKNEALGVRGAAYFDGSTLAYSCGDSQKFELDQYRFRVNGEYLGELDHNPILPDYQRGRGRYTEALCVKADPGVVYELCRLSNGEEDFTKPEVVAKVRVSSAGHNLREFQYSEGLSSVVSVKTPTAFLKLAGKIGETVSESTPESEELQRKLCNAGELVGSLIANTSSYSEYNKARKQADMLFREVLDGLGDPGLGVESADGLQKVCAEVRNLHIASLRTPTRFRPNCTGDIQAGDVVVFRSGSRLQSNLHTSYKDFPSKSKYSIQDPKTGMTEHRESSEAAIIDRIHSEEVAFVERGTRAFIAPGIEIPLDTLSENWAYFKPQDIVYWPIQSDGPGADFSYGIVEDVKLKEGELKAEVTVISGATTRPGEISKLSGKEVRPLKNSGPDRIRATQLKEREGLSVDEILEAAIDVIEYEQASEPKLREQARSMPQKHPLQYELGKVSEALKRDFTKRIQRFGEYTVNALTATESLSEDEMRPVYEAATKLSEIRPFLKALDRKVSFLAAYALIGRDDFSTLRAHSAEQQESAWVDCFLPIAEGNLDFLERYDRVLEGICGDIDNREDLTLAQKEEAYTHLEGARKLTTLLFEYLCDIDYAIQDSIERLNERVPPGLVISNASVEDVDIRSNLGAQEKDELEGFLESHLRDRFDADTIVRALKLKGAKLRYLSGVDEETLLREKYGVYISIPTESLPREYDLLGNGFGLLDKRRLHGEGGLSEEQASTLLSLFGAIHERVGGRHQDATTHPLLDSLIRESGTLDAELLNCEQGVDGLFVTKLAFGMTLSADERLLLSALEEKPAYAGLLKLIREGEGDE